MTGLDAASRSAGGGQGTAPPTVRTIVRLAGALDAAAAPALRERLIGLLHLTGLGRNLTICPDLRGALAAEREPLRVG